MCIRCARVPEFVTELYRNVSGIKSLPELVIPVTESRFRKYRRGISGITGNYGNSERKNQLSTGAQSFADSVTESKRFTDGLKQL